MSTARRGIISIVAAAVLTAGEGCSDKPSVSTSSSEAVVSGTVTIRGKKADSGEVVFNPANYLRKSEAARTAPIKPDGTYEIKTLEGDNNVTVLSPALKKDPALRTFVIPFAAKAGPNTFDITLPPAKPAGSAGQ